MGILRTDIVSHSQLEGSGSVEFDGVGDTLTFAAHSAFAPATADVTFECFINLSTFTPTSDGSYIFDMGANGYRFQIYNSQLYFGVSGNDYVGPISNAISINTWHHLAGVRDGNSLEFYVDGVHVGTKITTASVTTTSLVIGNHGGESQAGNYEPVGFISNFRYVRGVVYKGPFTPPKFELKNIPGTIVLGCQSTTSATDFAVTPSTVTANGDAAASAFHPNLKKDITDTGVVFDGVTTFDSQAYFVPPSGKTTERNRGRAIFAGGVASPYKDIQVVDISSGGIAQDFGDLKTAASLSGSASSSTRMLVTGMSDPAPTNIIEFVTIANIASSTDFGDLTEPRRRTQSLSNSTRAVHVGGTSASPASLYRNEIDFNTIATAGNSTDFGDTLAAHVATGGSVASSTRGVYSVGFVSGSFVNTIEFITIATTGNGQDFGDLNGGTIGYHFRGSTCDSTRGLFSGGYDPAGNVQNKIDFITIATTGNATDFGDLTVARRSGAGTANSIHSIFAGGYLPGVNNTIDRVLIQTAGNAVDFGDFAIKTHENSGSSDSHGGLS